MPLDCGGYVLDDSDAPGNEGVFWRHIGKYAYHFSYSASGDGGGTAVVSAGGDVERVLVRSPEEAGAVFARHASNW